MSNLIDATYTIYNNPFLLMPIIVKFYKNHEGENNNILLSYLILPLCLNEQLGSCRDARSNIVTFTNNLSNKELFYGLSQKIKEYKTLTNLCIQYAIDNNFLSINNNNNNNNNNLIFKTDKDIIIDTSIIKYIKNAENLKNIFTKNLDIPVIYNHLGIKKI